ncbi:glycosyltransferase family 2 protein [Turicibacter sanguinis]|uniref:glycosyltransferase family 2 protein n=1 Tax=Turicibacter sanguinis TaxID=154288 RepID=UPI0018AA3398|nr:glycosyltransferase family 2 protein [Turicibacter sanguinis]MDB8558559.1 glycosyltransferase family 2 protein [Turicibacter sanguinis]MDB8561355.1 glycosyltransferase family 2 protein [Turicibacter sanguinis]
MTKKTIAILIPCYNEEKTIGKVVSDFKLKLPEAKIYVYDNNSKDNSVKFASEQGAIVVKEYQQGKGFVIRSMFRDIDADCYIMVDGDDTYPVEDAIKIAQPILEGRADMAIGDRLSSTYFLENKRPFHNFGNVLVRFLINTLFKSNVQDIMTGCRAFNKKFVKSFPVLSSGFEIETEMTIHALDKRFLLVEEPIQYRDRPHGSVSKLNTFSDGFKVLLTIVKLFKDYKPLIFFSMISIILFILGVGLFVPIWIEFMETGIVPKIPTLIGCLGLGLSALLSFACGLILDTIKKHSDQFYELTLTLLDHKDRQ